MVVMFFHGKCRYYDRLVPYIECLGFIVYIIWMFPKIMVPPKHPKMVIFSRETNSCWVPSFEETPIYLFYLVWPPPSFPMTNEGL